MWDVASGDKIFTAKHTNLVFCGAFDTLATRIVTGGGGDRAAKVWDLRVTKDQ